MKKLFTLLAALMLTVSVGFAQQNYYFWKDGNFSFENASQVDSLTFGDDASCLFEISQPECTTVKAYSFQGTTKAAFNQNVTSIVNGGFIDVGICYSDENKTPTYDDNHSFLGTLSTNTNGKEYSFTIGGRVNPGTTYYYRTYIKLLDEYYYSEVDSVTTLAWQPADIEINGFNFVDLGLPSGLLWARTNVGASSDYENGDYYAWGEVEPKENYSWDTYKWGSKPRQLSKYNDSDSKTILDSEDDIAACKWGEGCRMPSSSDFEELKSECNWEWTTDYNGVSGYLVKGVNGNSVFLPASGYYSDDTLLSLGKDGYYWSRSLGSNNFSYASSLSFTSYSIYPAITRSRERGLPVRPVAEKIK